MAINSNLRHSIDDVDISPVLHEQTLTLPDCVIVELVRLLHRWQTSAQQMDSAIR